MIREEIKQYQQPDGLVSPNENPGIDSTGNGLMYTSLYYICLYNRNELNEVDADTFQKIVKNCSAHGSAWYGLLHRSKTKKYEQTAFDDYVAVCLAARLLRSDKLVWSIVNFGNQRLFMFFKWNYNNLTPIEFTFQSWFGRRIDAIAHMQSCIDEIAVHPLRLIYLLIYILVGGVSGHHQSIIIRYIYGAHSRYRIIRWAWLRFEKKVNRKYTNGMRDVLAKELGDLHPIVKYWV